eukprot:1157525-Pelagomonas_calceolata.AAC.5
MQARCYFHACCPSCTLHGIQQKGQKSISINAGGRLPGVEESVLWSILEDQASMLGVQLDDTNTNGLTSDSVAIFPSAIPRYAVSTTGLTIGSVAIFASAIPRQCGHVCKCYSKVCGQTTGLTSDNVAIFASAISRYVGERVQTYTTDNDLDSGHSRQGAGQEAYKPTCTEWRKLWRIKNGMPCQDLGQI